MGTPISFNSGTTTTYTTGVFKRGTIGLNLANSLASNTNWWNGVDVTATQYLIYSDIYSQGQSTFAGSRPTAWTTPDLTDASLIALINTLPDRVGLPIFTTVSQATNWLNQTGKYFLIKTGYENIVTSNLTLNLDPAWYTSYPGTGTAWNDISGNNSNFTLINGVGFSTIGQGSLSFDGTDDISTGNVSNINSTAGQYNTVTFWMYWAGNSGGFPFELGGYRLWTPGTNFGFNTGNGDIYGIDGTPLINTWVHVSAVFYNGAYTGNNKLYINGVLQTLTQRVGSASSGTASAGVAIGGYGGAYTSYPFQGKIGPFQIYNGELTQAQILQNFNAQAYRFGVNNDVVTSGLVLNLNAKSNLSYPGSGTKWFDLSGLNSVTDLYNGPTFSSDGYIQFDGTDDYGKNSATPQGFNFNVTNQITAEALIYFSASDYDFWFTANQGGIKYRFGTSPSGTFYWDMGQHVDKSGGSALPNNTWIYVAFTGGLENGQIVTRAYLNGVLHTSGNEGITSLSGIDDFYVGIGESPGTHPFNGRISYVRVYNRVLSTIERLQNYYGGSIVTDNLQFSVDAANFVSYPTTGTAWLDLTTNNNDVTLYNGPTFSSIGGGSIFFDGTDDYATAPGSSSTNISDFLTAEVWVYYESGDGRILQKDDWGSGTYTRCWEIGGYAGQFRMEIWHSNGTTAIGYGNNLAVNGWTHLALTFDGTNVRMYQNAVLVNTINFPGDIRTDINTPITLGGRWTTSEYLNGAIGLARIYNKALNGLEISQNFQAQKSRFGL